MSFEWQNLTALLVVAAAGVYLTRVAWQNIARRKAAGCGSCGSCPTGTEAKQPQLFAIGPAPRGEEPATNGKLSSKAIGR
ncbi:MAG TPA: hypothetical protein VGZ26_11810 [Pirellulales bacterium]|jgi:hypothetical protein|nr:hypothetical protein [Pirellulales bacterium]